MSAMFSKALNENCFDLQVFKQVLIFIHTVAIRAVNAYVGQDHVIILLRIAT